MGSFGSNNTKARPRPAKHRSKAEAVPDLPSISIHDACFGLQDLDHVDARLDESHQPQFSDAAIELPMLQDVDYSAQWPLAWHADGASIDTPLSTQEQHWHAASPWWSSEWFAHFSGVDPR